eukprot:TRINITY_DN30356_c0_g1_i1.p1 TRINITY_DN30356_c0_g1~~TRINITY_DN30356_c0_g1_i1.p1  ORF type:complete len:532 (-),score=51.36 TRINITY_DN30356_c0_g1_i1:347-1891(-)
MSLALDKGVALHEADRGTQSTFGATYETGTSLESEIPDMDGYVFREWLDGGHAGTVYRATKTTTSTSLNESSFDCAVKVYSAHGGEDAFERELQMLRLVQGHPNVISLLDFHTKRPRAIVMPLHKRNLLQYIDEQRRCTEEDAARLMFGLVEAVKHIHRLGVIHRDVKPDNIAVSRRPILHAVLLDFDVACLLSDERAMRQKVHSAGYSAPELLTEGSVYDASVDLFSLGCVLYFMLERKSPFHTIPFRKHAVRDLTRRCEYSFGARFVNVSSACKAMVTSLIVKDAFDRLSIEECVSHPWFAEQCWNQMQSESEPKAAVASGKSNLLPWLSESSSYNGRSRSVVNWFRRQMSSKLEADSAEEGCRQLPSEVSEAKDIPGDSSMSARLVDGQPPGKGKRSVVNWLRKHRTSNVAHERDAPSLDESTPSDANQPPPMVACAWLCNDGKTSRDGSISVEQAASHTQRARSRDLDSDSPAFTQVVPFTHSAPVAKQARGRARAVSASFSYWRSKSRS